MFAIARYVSIITSQRVSFHRPSSLFPFRFENDIRLSRRTKWICTIIGIDTPDHLIRTSVYTRLTDILYSPSHINSLSLSECFTSRCKSRFCYLEYPCFPSIEYFPKFFEISTSVRKSESKAIVENTNNEFAKIQITRCFYLAGIAVDVGPLKNSKLAFQSKEGKAGRRCKFGNASSTSGAFRFSRTAARWKVCRGKRWVSGRR